MIFRRILLVFFTTILLLFGGLCAVLAMVFLGPSATARDVLVMSLTEASATKWVPGVFLGDELVEQIRAKDEVELPSEVSDLSAIVVQKDGAISGSDEWKDYPEGIKITEISGDTYNAYVMIINDPSRVYLATSSEKFSRTISGTRINRQIEKEGAVAAINGGAFFDDGTSSPEVGTVPCGLTFSKGECKWDDGTTYQKGFVGFTEDNILVVAQSMTKEQAEEIQIRDACCFGPVLIMNGMVNEEAYNSNSGYNPRTCIGQREDGAVVFVCVDGRQAGSLGATYADLIDIMAENDVVNACNLDGGSSTVMLYRDTTGRYGEADEVQMINNYSLLQQEPRKMPTFFMVRPISEE